MSVFYLRRSRIECFGGYVLCLKLFGGSVKCILDIVGLYEQINIRTYGLILS